MKAYFHLPGLYEFYDFYTVFLPLFDKHREYFYDWCEIGSIYGSPSNCIWNGGRLSEAMDYDVLSLVERYSISARLTFSNSLLEEKHLQDERCNALCSAFNKKENGIIVHSDLLLKYLHNTYPNLYFISSTTKVILDYDELVRELNRDEFKYVVPDFRLNKQLFTLNQNHKDKIEFLCNECCFFGCTERKECYESVSKINLGLECKEHICKAPHAKEGYVFSRAMTNPGFISKEDIMNVYLPSGFSNFKIEGRGLGSALLLEFILYYMTKPECHIHVREHMYLDNTLDLF